MIGFVMFVAIGAVLLVGAARRLLRLDGRLAGGVRRAAVGARGDSRIIPGSTALTGIRIPG
jgi:hypothetical protein